jgi:hypothetical protein
MLYGFVVAAWLIFPWNNGQMAIPFATMDACEAAKSASTALLQKPPTCVPSGAGEKQP